MDQHSRRVDGKRYHLDGTEAGDIAEQHRDTAKTVIANRAAGGMPPANRSKPPAPARQVPVP